jgi:hypothetical protein
MGQNTQISRSWQGAIGVGHPIWAVAYLFLCISKQQINGLNLDENWPQ